MSRLGIDYAWKSSLDTAGMKRAGVTFVLRYLSHDSGKNLTRTEANTLSKADIDVGVVWETTAARALAGYNAGASDAREAASQAHNAGMPPDRPIYFAVDFDASDGQKAGIRTYFNGAASVLGKDRVGAYAGYWVIKDLLDHGTIKYGWQTYAWSGGRRDARAQLYQYHNGVRVAGIDSDWNRAYATDFGQWRTESFPAGPADAAKYNAAGQHHNDVWCAPKHISTPLYYPNGTPTGQTLERGALLYPGHEGKVQLDFKEVVPAAGRRFLFARGGYIPDRDPVPYGHVWIGDLAESPGSPVAPGDGRGAAAAHTRLVTLEVTAIPDEMGYKPTAGSHWATYGDSGAKYGYPDHYSYMTWSYPNDGTQTVAGGGLVRSLVPNGGHLWLCNVERIHGASYGADGEVNGVVTGAYCERSGLFGWVVVAYQLTGQDLVHLIR